MERPSWVSASAVIVAGLFTLLGFVALASYAISSLPGTTLDLALVVVLAVIALISAVAFVVVAYSFFGLHDRQHALGLPEGSVRALVAMMLVILFAIFAAYFFDRLDDQARPGQADFAKQVLVLIGTLVTAVVSYYFASRTSTEAAAAVADSPEITGIDPARAAAGETVTVTIPGTKLLAASKVKLVRGTEEILVTDVLSSADRIRGRFVIPAGATKGRWDVVVEAPPKPAVRLTEAFEIT